MKTYSVQIKFVTDYLQARFTEDAKAELENYISRGIVKSKNDSWFTLLHRDDNGIFIPNIQLKNCLKNAGKEFKVKKKRSNMRQWVTSFLTVEPQEIYLKKEQPDKVLTSYPLRKDGTRVTIKHPCFLKGTVVGFLINSLDDEMEEKAIKNLVIMAGKMYGIGARRADTFGRFEVIKFQAE